MAKGMNTSGPNGGRGVPSAASVKGSTVRTTGFQARPHALNTSMGPSLGLDSQKPQSKQAKVNAGPMTDFNVSRQKLSATKVPAGQNYTKPKVNSGAFQNRSTQNSMKGTGSTKG